MDDEIFGPIMCPICGSACIEERLDNITTYTACFSGCKQYHYHQKNGRHLETISGLTFVLSESLSDEQYEMVEAAITNAVFVAAKEYWKGKKTVNEGEQLI